MHRLQLTILFLPVNINLAFRQTADQDPAARRRLQWLRDDHNNLVNYTHLGGNQSVAQWLPIRIAMNTTLLDPVLDVDRACARVGDWFKVRLLSCRTRATDCQLQTTH